MPPHDRWASFLSPTYTADGHGTPIRYQESEDRNQISERRLRRWRKIVETPIGFHLIPDP
jgi:hypothetical protein